MTRTDTYLAVAPALNGAQVTPSVEVSIADEGLRPPVQIASTRSTARAAPRLTTSRRSGPPGVQAVRGLPSTARSGSLMPGGSGDDGYVIRPSARSAVGV